MVSDFWATASIGCSRREADAARQKVRCREAWRHHAENYLTASLALLPAALTASLLPSFAFWPASTAASFTFPAASSTVPAASLAACLAAVPACDAASLAESRAFATDSLALFISASFVLEHPQRARVSATETIMIRSMAVPLERV